MDFFFFVPAQLGSAQLGSCAEGELMNVSGEEKNKKTLIINTRQS